MSRWILRRKVATAILCTATAAVVAPADFASADDGVRQVSFLSKMFGKKSAADCDGGCDVCNLPEITCGTGEITCGIAEAQCGCEAPQCGCEQADCGCEEVACGCEPAVCGCEPAACGCETAGCDGCQTAKRSKFKDSMNRMKSKLKTMFRKKSAATCDDGCDAMMMHELSGHPFASLPQPHGGHIVCGAAPISQSSMPQSSITRPSMPQPSMPQPSMQAARINPSTLPPAPPIPTRDVVGPRTVVQPRLEPVPMTDIQAAPLTDAVPMQQGAEVFPGGPAGGGNLQNGNNDRRVDPFLDEQTSTYFPRPVRRTQYLRD